MPQVHADIAPYVEGGRRILSHFVGLVDEFVAPYVGGAASSLPEHLSLPATDLGTLFGLLDADGDGQLDRGELGQVLSILLERPVAGDELDRLFDEIDGERDGLISRHEMLDAVGGGGEASPELWALRRILTPRRVATYAHRRAVADGHQDLFSDDAVDVPTLQERAYNHRWAIHPPDVIPLTAADSDFPVCDQVLATVRDYLASGYLPYGPVEGLPQLRRAATDFLRARDGLDCEPDTIFPTDGAASALFLVARLALAPGDQAIIPGPPSTSSSTGPFGRAARR